MAVSWMVLALGLGLAAAKPHNAPEVNPVWVSNCGRSKYPDANVEGFIVGGRDARPGENPWQVSVTSRSGSHFCGGVIINQNWVLTAAHCTQGETANRIRVVVGEHDRSSNSNPVREIISVRRIIENEWYGIITGEDADIGLLQLSTPITFSEDVQPACPPRQTAYVSETCTVSGWGTLRSGGGSLPNVLQQVNLPIQSNTNCQRELPQDWITDGMICANGGTEKDSCQGDSGGPLVVKNSSDRFEIVGLVSWGYGCAGGTPGVYCRVSEYMDWIQSTITRYS